MKYISSDPAILSGMPVVRGTRVPVARILSLFRDGYTIEEIHEQFDHITVEKLEGAIEEVTRIVNKTSYDAQVL